MPGPTRQSGVGVGRATYSWGEEHITYARRIAAVREFGGSRAVAALALLVHRTPPPSIKWVRRALREAFLRYAGNVTAGQIRQACQEQWSPRRRKRRLAHGARDPREGFHLNHMAHAISGTRNPADGMSRALATHQVFARLALEKQESEDTGSGDLSGLRVLDVIDHAPEEDIWRAFSAARRGILQYGDELREKLTALPLFKGRSNAEIVETILHYPGLFKDVPPVAALLPSFMIGFLLNPSARDVQALAALVGVTGQEQQDSQVSLLTDQTTDGAISTTSCRTDYSTTYTSAGWLIPTAERKRRPSTTSRHSGILASRNARDAALLVTGRRPDLDTARTVAWLPSP